MADTVANLLLRIRGDNRDAKQSLREIAEEIKVFNGQDAVAEVRLRGAEAANAEIKKLEAALTLVGSRKVTADVKVRIEDYRAKLSVLRRELEHALSGGAGARPLEHILGDIGRLGHDVGRLGGDFESFGAKVANAFTSGANSAGQLAGAVGSSLISGLGSVLSSFGLIALAGLVLLPIISALVAVFAALAASLGAALVGGLIIAIGAFGAFIPVIAVVAAAVKRLMDVYQAFNKHQANAAAQAKALQAAQQSQADAARNVGEAQKNVSDQLVAARRAEVDAANAARDAELGLQEARLGEADAKLRLDEAKAAVKGLGDEAKAAGPDIANLFQKFKDVDFKPSAGLLNQLKKSGVSGNGDEASAFDVRQKLLDLAHAQLGVDEANQHTKESTVALTRVQQTNADFIQHGIMAYQPYVQALQQAAQAQRQLTAAEQNTADVRKQGQLTDASGKKFSGPEVEAAKAISSFVDTLKKLFGPVLQDVIKGVVKLLQDLTDIVSDRKLQSAFGLIGKALESMLSNLGKILDTREVKDIFAALATTGAKVVKVFGSKVFPDLILIFGRLARAAGPAVLRLFEGLGNFLDRIAGKTKDASSLNRTIGHLVDSFFKWLGLARSLARLILAFFGDAKGTGDDLVTTIHKLFDRWTAFLDTKEGQEAVKEWLKQGVTLAGHLVDAFGGLFSFMQRILPLANKLIDDAGKAAKFVKGVAGGARKVTNALGLTQTDDDQALGIDAASVNKEVTHLQSIIHEFFHSRGPRKQRLYKEILNLAGALSPDVGESVDQILKDLGVTKRAWGGSVPGTGGFGDSTLLHAEGGEYVIRRSVVASMGKGYFDALNSGIQPVGQGIGTGGRSGGRSGTYGDVHVTLPPAPRAAVPDARWQAIQLGKELKRRGG